MSTKRKATSKIAQPVVKQSAKKALKTNINEAETAVSVPGFAASSEKQDAIEISSDSASSDYELSDDESPAGQSTEAKDNGEDSTATKKSTVNGASKESGRNSKEDADPDTEMMSPDGESDQEPAQPTFGELARVEEIIDVPSALSIQPTNALTTSGRALAPPNSASLGTVLTQALRTDDNDLLESCLHTTDLNTVSNTIQRLDSTLAGTLLVKLAARMHRRPGRAGSLMTWVQWTLVAHGGALATQPGLVKKLSELHRVLEERSRGLNSLLALKGKLDMLEAQMQLRRGLRGGVDSDDSDDEDEEQGVVYVEGEEDSDMAAGFDVEDDDDELPVTNGFADDDSEDDEESSDVDEDDDEELEGEEDLDENDVIHADVSSDDEDSEGEAETAPPAKRSRTGLSSKRR